MEILTTSCLVSGLSQHGHPEKGKYTFLGTRKFCPGSKLRMRFNIIKDYLITQVFTVITLTSILGYCSPSEYINDDNTVNKVFQLENENIFGIVQGVNIIENDMVSAMERTVSASIELIFVSMENTCSERFSSVSSDEVEWFLYPKRIKIESDQKNIEKKEQQKLEQSIHYMDRYQTSPHEPTGLSERQNSWAVEKKSCDTARKTCMREFFHFPTCSSERFPGRVSETKLPNKKWSPENENQITMEDGISLNVHGQPSETEVCNVWNAGNTYENLQVLNTPQVQHSDNIEYSNKRNGDNELDQNSSVTPFNRDLFQMELLNHRSVSDKKWKQYQLLQIPFFCGTSSVFSHIENEKNNFLTKVCNAENKDYSSSDSETTTERDNKEKDISSSIVPTLKPFKRLQLMQIPNFQFSSISNKINSKIPPANLEEMNWKNFKDQPSLLQSKQINGVQKVSETGKQKLKNDESRVKSSIVDSEFKEKNYLSSSKQECSPLAERGTVSVTYSRGNSADIECNQIFPENYLKCKMVENSECDDDHKSRILIYISAKNVQKDKCVSNNDLLKRTGRESTNSNESVAAFHIQTSVPVTTEALGKNELDTHCGVHNSNSDLSLYEAESKLSTKEILDFKRCFTKNALFESSCSHIIVQNFPDTDGTFDCSSVDEMDCCNITKIQYLIGAQVRFWNYFPAHSKLKFEQLNSKDSRSFVHKDEAVSEDGHCRDSSSVDIQKQSEEMNAMTQHPSKGRPAMTDTHLELQAKETVQFFSQGHTQTNEAISLEPAALKRHPAYVKEQEEISDEQMHVTNESQCETVMKDLIMSYSEDECKTFIAAEEKLKMHLSVMNNECLEVVKDTYLPLENKITCEFELKRKFDLVLEELHMFHEISKGNENNLSSLETNSHSYCELNNSEGVAEDVTSVSQKKVCISSSVCGTVEGQNITDSNEISLAEKKSNDSEDENLSKEYCISRLSSEDLLHSPIAEGYFDAAYDKPYMWNPAFLSCMLPKEQKYNLQKEADLCQNEQTPDILPVEDMRKNIPLIIILC
ncbi:Rad51ap2 [Columba livia]|nr:Rad51ap2 [Columba livia]